MKKIIILALLSAAMLSTPAHALKGFKEGEWVEGANKYCRYSNGVIITIKSYKLCPLSIN